MFSVVGFPSFDEVQRNIKRECRGEGENCDFVKVLVRFLNGGVLPYILQVCHIARAVVSSGYSGHL